MKVEKISKTKSNKYKIKFDNDENLITYDDVIINNNLLSKGDIDDDKLSKIFKDTEYYDVYNKVIKYLSRKMRSEKEVKDFLSDFELKEDDKNKIIDNLKKISLINDVTFSKAFVTDRFNLSNDGPFKIKRELERHNVNDDVIEDAISYICEGELCDKVTNMVLKKIKSNKKDSSYILRQKVVMDLSNKGYDKGLVSDIFDANKKDDKAAIEYNYNSILRREPKIDRKKLFQKLYKKGFSMNDINLYLNEKGME